jgi:hypothetical protein
MTPLHRLPRQVTIDLEEIRALVIGLEELRLILDAEQAEEVDELIGRILRWLWPIFDELDGGGS